MSNRTYHASEYKDAYIRFGLVAYVHKLDTHANWSAQFHSSRDDGGPGTSAWLFRNYHCDADILHEFIKRGLVISAEKKVTDTFSTDMEGTRRDA